MNQTARSAGRRIGFHKSWKATSAKGPGRVVLHGRAELAQHGVRDLLSRVALVNAIAVDRRR